MKKKEISVSGLFVGCGGLDYGFQQAGFALKWANELSEDAAESCAELTGHGVVVGDIWRVIDQIPASDVLIGGPPCQSFSLVGKRIESDPRGQLVFAYQQVVERTRPRAFVMENVPGLMASRIDGKRLPVHLAEQFTKLGYEVLILKLLATDFFVPQKRQRVLMIGHRIRRKSFEMIGSSEFATLLGVPSLKSPVTVAEALDDLPSPLPKGAKGCIDYASPPHSAFARLMRKNVTGEVALQTMPTMSKLDREFVRHIPPGGNYMNIPDSVSTKRIMSFKSTGGRTTTYGRLHPDRPAYTINTFFNRPNVGANYHHKEERLITVREAMRLQSFPDYFVPKHSSQRSLHMQIGNAVPPLMARAVAESLKKLFE
jgi:DNA (cytosine-5)-methyltransferase 1